MKNKKWIKLRLVIYSLLAIGFVLVAIFGEKIVPYDPYAPDYMALEQPPSAAHWFGTDNLGRDIFSRVIVGTKTTMLATVFIIVSTLMIGTIVGVLAGYYGGILDAVIMKVILILQSFPGEVLAIALAGVLGAGIFNAALAMSVVNWVGFARISRSMVLKIKASNYIKAARLYGCSSPHIIIHHIIPNISSVLFVNALTNLAGVILGLSSLSFLGLSATPPTPEWGFMMSEGRKVLMTSPWQALTPGIVILITVIIFNRLGDTVQDYLEVRTGR